VRYAVDGYGVFSCVIGGMIDRMRGADVVSVVMRATENPSCCDNLHPLSA